jgi:hypothetical protein
VLAGCGGGPSGWSATVPDGWKNATLRINAQSNTDLQAIYQGPKDGGVRASISVASVRAAAGDTLASITEAGRRNLVKAYGRATTTSEPVDTRLAGEPAMRFDYEAEGGQVRQLGVLHRGHFYLVSLTAAPSAWGQRLQAFDELLRSWRWK